MEKLKAEIVQRLEKGEKFSLTGDEWTGLHGRKYVNLTLKTMDGKMVNLGKMTLQCYHRTDVS